MIAGTLDENDISKKCSKLLAEIEKVDFSLCKQFIFRASALREEKHYDGILFVEKKVYHILNSLTKRKS